MTYQELTRDWKLQRLQQIKRLYTQGIPKDELIRRFGKKNVSRAIGA
jgi:hypothetical protein